MDQLKDLFNVLYHAPPQDFEDASDASEETFQHLGIWHHLLEFLAQLQEETLKERKKIAIQVLRKREQKSEKRKKTGCSHTEVSNIMYGRAYITLEFP